MTYLINIFALGLGFYIGWNLRQWCAGLVDLAGAMRDDPAEYEPPA